MNILTTTIGYPLMGKSREVKKALESHWREKITAESLLGNVKEVEEASWKTQLAAGIAYLTLGQVWANADCGLKTQRWQEVIPFFQNMVVARQQMQENSHEK